MIRAGRVSVNGRPAGIGDSADPATDRIELDGERLRASASVYWVVNKPRGVLSTVRDPEGRPTVIDLLPRHGGRAFPVGRLDRDTEGLLLLTNDGELTHALLHPSHEVEREYVVRVRGQLSPRERARLEKGVHLEDGVTSPARVSKLHFDAAEDVSEFHLTLIEGRKRQIRRALAALGHPVRSLARIRMGPLKLGRLARGAVRPLTPAERSELMRLREASVAGDAPRPDAQPGGRSGPKGRGRKRKRGVRRKPAG